MNEPRRPTDCDMVLAQLFELRELDPAAAEAVKTHLAGCAGCRAAAAFDVRLSRLLGHDDVAVEPAAVVAAVGHRLRRRRRVAAAVYATAAAVLVAGALAVWRPWAADPQMVVESHRGPAAGDDLAALFGPPPVDSLDVLARQQSGYVAVLHRMGEE